MRLWSERRCSDQIKSKGKPLGPLHGLPISVKDSFQVAGTEATIGFVSFLGEKSTSNSPIVDILLSLGAVPYVKTNIPMTLMTADSDNNIFGRALNPHNTMLNAGGSSGGEGALVAFRGSPIGVGTDGKSSHTSRPVPGQPTKTPKPRLPRCQLFFVNAVRPEMGSDLSCSGWIYPHTSLVLWNLRLQAHLFAHPLWRTSNSRSTGLEADCCLRRTVDQRF